MVSYKFKFQKILDLKNKQEEDKKNQMADVMKKLREKEKELEELDKTKKEKLRHLEKIREEGATIQEIRNLTQYNGYLEKCIKRAEEEIASLEMLLNTKKEEYLGVRKERKSYESLKEKDVERYLYREKKQEEKIIDQIVTFQKRGIT